jgi:hypothetical protein
MRSTYGLSHDNDEYTDWSFTSAGPRVEVTNRASGEIREFLLPPLLGFDDREEDCVRESRGRMRVKYTDGTIGPWSNWTDWGCRVRLRSGSTDFEGIPFYPAFSPLGESLIVPVNRFSSLTTFSSFEDCGIVEVEDSAGFVGRQTQSRCRSIARSSRSHPGRLMRIDLRTGMVAELASGFHRSFNQVTIGADGREIMARAFTFSSIHDQHWHIVETGNTVNGWKEKSWRTYDRFRQDQWSWRCEYRAARTGALLLDVDGCGGRGDAVFAASVGDLAPQGHPLTGSPEWLRAREDETRARARERRGS